MPERPSSDELAATLAPLSRARTLSPGCYTDPAFFALERDAIFRREWTSVGRVEQVARPGDYFSVDLFGEPIVVVRGTDAELRALSRVCRHRWMILVEGEGNRSSLQCPYHLWTYGLDGALRNAPFMDQAQGFERADCRLPEFRLEVWQGWIFLNLDPQAEPLAPRLAPLERALAPYQLAEMRSAGVMEFDSRWNWKVMVDNFMESYHHMGPHSKTLQPLYPGAGTYAEDNAGPYSVLVNPAKDPGPPLLPAIEGLPPEALGHFLVCAVFPFHLCALSPDHMVWYQLGLHGHDHFTLRIHLCVPEGTLADSTQKPALEALQGFLRAVHLEDIAACQGVWRGLQSRNAGVGRLSHLEKSLWQFGRWLLERVT